MFLKEKGKEPLNTQFLQEGHGLFAVEVGGEVKIHSEKAKSGKHQEGLRARCAHGRRSQGGSTGTADHGLGKASATKAQVLPAVDRSPPTSSCRESQAGALGGTGL